MNRLLALSLIILSVISATALAATTVKSPDQKISVEIRVDDQISWKATYEEVAVIEEGIIGLEVNGKDLMQKTKIQNTFSGLVIQEVKPAIPLKFKQKTAQFTEVKLDLKRDISIVFRVFNSGVAYRIITNFKRNSEIENEIALIKFAPATQLIFPEEISMVSHYERSYKNYSISEIKDSMFCSLPMLATSAGIRVGITEAGVLNYPHMFLKGNGDERLKALFPKYPLNIIPDERRKDRNEIVVSEADFIATVTPGQALPWRVFMVAKDDKDLITNSILSCLNGSSKIKTDWIKPGKVAWDWWNANNIYGVDFKSGINTETYKYYIDFASKFGLEYIILDEGWTKSTTEVMESQKDINLEELISYGKEKGVDIILWVLWKPLNENLEEILALYKSWGVVGVKVDFMQRADQKMVQIYEKIAAEAAKQKLMVDFHGAFKPSGLEALYPNVINYEGLKGLEHNKWSEDITPEHNLTLPFTRMLAGMLDYTPGAMRNMHNNNFNISFERPMSMGTRCHQAAMYVIYEAPLQMLADNPSNYLADPVYTGFISKIPVIWHDMKVMEASVGDYLVLARKNGNKWYLGGMTDETPRSFNIKMDFLDAGKTYNITLVKDGINADRMAEDYQLVTLEVTSESLLDVNMVSGGGVAAIIEPK